MIKLDKAFLIIGLSLIMSAGIIYVSDCYIEQTMLQNIEIALDNSKVELENTEVNSNSSTLVDFDDSIEVLGEDQVIEKVETYKNVLEIPHLDIKAYISRGTDNDALARGLGWHETTAELGSVGNTVVAGHSSDIYKCVLNNIKNIQLLETFYCYDNAGVKHEYYVTDKFVVTPDNTSILTNVNSKQSQVTIYTCTERGKKRLVIIGKEFSPEQLEEFMASLEAKYISNMQDMNNSIVVTNLAEQINSRLKPIQKKYSIDFKYSGVLSETIRLRLLYPVLFDKLVIKEHSLVDNYTNLGFSGGFSYDISAN